MENVDLITGLDIGTTKIGCFIAEVDEVGEIKIVGVGVFSLFGNFRQALRRAQPSNRQYLDW